MKNFLRILLGLVISVVVIYFFLPGYVQTALIYQTADIDDYKIFENRIIESGIAQPWPTHPSYNSYELEETERLELESYKPVAYLVIQDGQVLYEEYWDGFGTNSLSNSFSAGKSVVSLLIGIAKDEGYIESLDQKVMDFIPEYNKPANRDLTIKHLLSMSSGLNWDEAYTSPFSMTTEAYYGTNLTGLVKSLEVIEKPGLRFNYLSGNTEVLAMVVQAATGRSISKYASEKIWRKIGAEHDALWSLDQEDGMEKAYCCFNTNARDFARFGQLVLNNGKWDSTQIISEEYLKEATSAAVWLEGEDGNPLSYYGYQYWIIKHKGMEIPYMRGILGQYIIPIKEKNAVIVRLGHERDHSYTNFHPNDVYKYIDLGLKILEN
jgi:CubicO group peptidase (beta-lactamase class C family)